MSPSLVSRRPEIGVGLWSMQATPPVPRAHKLLYEELASDAQTCERLGLDSLWISEHHLWFDGYCPSPLVASGLALAATDRLRVGTAVTLLPLHEPKRLADAAMELFELSEGRFLLGVAAGYRAEEFEAFGVQRSHRGRDMEASIETIRDRWGGRPSPTLYVGGASEPATLRAARSGSGLLLPSPLPPERVRVLIEAYRAAGGPGPVGVMRDLWIDTSTATARSAALPWLTYAHTQYAVMEGLRDAEDITMFASRATEASILGTPALALKRLAPIRELGVDLILLRIRWGDQSAETIARVLREIARNLVPALSGGKRT